MSLKNMLLRKGFSKMEISVTEFLVKGMSNKEIAEKLFICEGAVKVHLVNIYRRTGLKSRHELIVKCFTDWKSFLDIDFNKKKTSINLEDGRRKNRNPLKEIMSIPGKISIRRHEVGKR